MEDSQFLGVLRVGLHVSIPSLPFAISPPNFNNFPTELDLTRPEVIFHCSYPTAYQSAKQAFLFVVPVDSLSNHHHIYGQQRCQAFGTQFHHSKCLNCSSIFNKSN